MFRVSIPVTCSQTLPKYINNLRIKIFLCLFGGMRMASPQTYIGHMYTHTITREIGDSYLPFGRPISSFRLLNVYESKSVSCSVMSDSL